MRLSDNKIITRLVNQDQKERLHFCDNPEKVTKNDEIRRNKLKQLIKLKRLKTWKDYYNASLIFLHGLEIDDYKKSVELAQKSISLNNSYDSKWIYAVSLDRLLIKQNKKQKFGTQFRRVEKKDPKTGKFILVREILPYDKRTSDKTRLEHDVAPLEILLKKK